MLYVLPLEPMEERYTEQWYRWFKFDCFDLGIDNLYINGEQLGSEVEVGTVLDASGTNFWKATQLAKVCSLFKQRLVKDGDIFFTMDMWHPGLECIPYMATLYGLDVQVSAFLHAGSYTEEDFAAPMARWAQWFEKGWASLCRHIFVGSSYHKEKFEFLRVEGMEDVRIHVTGNPIRLSEMPELNLQPRENVIIFSNRWDKEKRPDVFVEAMKRLWEVRQDFHVVVTTSRPEFRSNDPELLHILDAAPFPYEIKAGLSKQEYYTELSKAKVFVSTTVEENFGYCLIEAMASGVTPVVANGFSHCEILSGLVGHLVEQDPTAYAGFCFLALDRPHDPVTLRAGVQRYEDSFKEMIRIMTNG